MATFKLFSTIFLLLVIIFSLFVDQNKAFAIGIQHRKLSGSKETIPTRRNLEENGGDGSKIDTSGSVSGHAGSKTDGTEPSETDPDETTTQGQVKTVFPINYKPSETDPDETTTQGQVKTVFPINYKPPETQGQVKIVFPINYKPPETQGQVKTLFPINYKPPETQGQVKTVFPINYKPPETRPGGTTTQG